MPRILFVHALSPLHAGTGQSSGAVDLPIARDRATAFPLLPGSSIKGVLRDRCQHVGTEPTALFGPDTVNASDHAGSFSVDDANLLLLPVRSVSGTFAWATSPYLLARFARDLGHCGEELSVRGPEQVDRCWATTQTRLEVRERIYFEDLDFGWDNRAASCTYVADLATRLGQWLFPADNTWQTMLQHRLCILHDDAMSFMAKHATDVVTRVRISDESKTVERGALWTEENLPSESVLVSLVEALPNRRAGLDETQIFQQLAQLTETPLQLGGKATVGRGRCRLLWAQGRAR